MQTCLRLLFHQLSDWIFMYRSSLFRLFGCVADPLPSGFWACQISWCFDLASFLELLGLPCWQLVNSTPQTTASSFYQDSYFWTQYLLQDWLGQSSLIFQSLFDSTQFISQHRLHLVYFVSCGTDPNISYLSTIAFHLHRVNSWSFIYSYYQQAEVDHHCLNYHHRGWEWLSY